MCRKLSILLLEDNLGGTTPDITDATRTWVDSMFDSNVQFDNVEDTVAALEYLRESDYDVLLLDINLGDTKPYGGIETLVIAWQLLIEKGTVPILYSADPDCQRAYKAFETDGGPFRFVMKGAYQDNYRCLDALIAPLVEALRKRARWRAQAAEMKSVQQVHNDTDTVIHVEIKGECWSMNSLVAPYLYKLPEEVGLTRSAVIHGLFPSDDRVRMLSYWFKSSDFVWPNPTTMYGLEEFKIGNSKSGVMDYLTHEPHGFDFNNYKANLISHANKEFSRLQLCFDDDAKDRLRQYLTDVNSWTCIPCSDCLPMTKPSQFPYNQLKDGVAFKISDIVHVIKGKFGETVSLADTISKSLNFTYYQEPGRILGVENGRLLRGLSILCTSIVEAPEVTQTEAFIDTNGKLYKSPTSNADMPYLRVILWHNGKIWSSRHEVENRTRKERTHKLGKARKDLESYCQWHILWRDGESFNFHSPLGEKLILRDEMTKCWDKFKDSATVLHILKIGVPLFHLIT